MKVKRIITCIISFILFTVCIPFTATAKVIEPEVVKTEKWTTSYYIDDDMDTLYPYIQCEADIYNDGTIKLYMWNTHEWDGFATVSHTITIMSGEILYNNSNVLPYSVEQQDGKNEYTITKYMNDTFVMSCVSYCDSNYTQGYDGGTGGNLGWFIGYMLNNGTYSYKGDIVYSVKDSDQRQIYDYRLHTANLPLPELKSYSNRNEIRHWYEFRPKVDPTGTYNFRLFGHDITITPELLSGNIVSEPVLTEQEQYIKQLEEENKKLKEQLNNPYTGYITIEQNNGTAAERFPVTVYSDGRTETTEEFQNYINSLNVKIEQLMNRINLVSNGFCGDIDGDGNISVEDAQLLLQYYTESKVAQLTDDPIDVWYFVKFGRG